MPREVEPLALAGDGLQDLDPFGHRLQDLVAEGGVLGQHPPEEVVRDQEHPAVRERPPRREEGRARQQRHLGEEGARRVGVYDHLAAVGLLGDPELPLEDHVEVLDGLALPAVDLARRHELLRALLQHAAQLFVGEPVEERYPAQLLERRHGCSSGEDRQPHLEAGVAGFGEDADVALVVFDDHAVGDVQAEARALADVLGRVEGLEDPLPHVFGDAGAVVGDLDEHPPVLAGGADRDRPWPSTASMALSRRLVQTWFSSPAWPQTRGRSFS